MQMMETINIPWCTKVCLDIFFLICIAMKDHLTLCSIKQNNFEFVLDEKLIQRKSILKLREVVLERIASYAILACAQFDVSQSGCYWWHLYWLSAETMYIISR